MNIILIFISITIVLLVFFIIFINRKTKNIDVYLISSKDQKDFQIELISLPKDEKRRKELKVKPDYIYSVNGNNIDRNELINANILDKDSKLKKGEIGCFLSHIHLLKKAIESKKKYVLILEDDAKIEENIFKDIDDILKQAPKDFEMIFLGHNYYEEEKENFELKKINYLHGAQAYIVNTNTITMEKIDKLLPFKRPYDVIVPKIFKCYVVIPKIVTLSKYGNISNTQGIN